MLNLPSLNARARERYAEPKIALKTRLQERTADQRDEDADKKRWRTAVIKRDGKICRCCKRKVVQQLALAPERLEVHHVFRRDNQITRWDVRNGVVLCSSDHEAVTHNKIAITQSARKLFTAADGKTYLNADKILKFTRKQNGKS